MAGNQRHGERLRPTPILVAASVVVIIAVGVFLINLPARRTGTAWAWTPALVGAVLAALACRQAGAAAGLDRVAQRLWRQLALVCALLVVGLADDARRWSPGPEVGDQHSPALSAGYAPATLVLLWALLRLPAGTREHKIRFVLDTVTVSITVATFAWYLTGRGLAGSDSPGRDAVPMLMLSVLGLIGALALIKVAMGGLGGLERGSIALLCAAATVCAVGGLVENAQLSVPGALLLVVFAADRQRRVAGIPLAEGARRPLGYVRYVAIAATDVLLLLVSRDAGGVTLVVAVAVVLLTAIVVARQIGALWENRRLLRRVDDGALKLDRYQQQLVHRTNHDQLTGLANRALFEQQTRAALAVADPATGGALSLALIDLDDFKAINDRLGHAVGDALLVVVAQRLRDCVRNDDVIARLGGDEFGLLLHGLRGSAATAALARISQALSRPVHALGYDLLVHASVGLAEVWPDASPQELLRRADVAMYAAKERGKGRHAVYDEQLEQDQTADAQLGAALRRALDNSEFSLVYQPIVALPAGTWTGLEALVRWHSPERGFVGPDTFIPIAERTGLIVPLGDWILRTALRQGVAWDQQYGSAAPREIGVNVSARQLREPGFADDVRRALAETGFDPERLVVEVTETAVFDGGVALDALHSLVGLGVKIALDDFGTGHSSLGLLRTCPTDTLKVDKSFVDGIGGRSEEAVIATAMIQITDGLHLQAIAEGVETAEQAETLYRLGYRFAQGYHFSRPLSREQVGERLDETVAPLPA